MQHPTNHKTIKDILDRYAELYHDGFDYLEFRSFIKWVLRTYEEAVRVEKCECPKEPKKVDLNNHKEVDKLLKYAGRVNYNKSIDDIIQKRKAFWQEEKDQPCQHKWIGEVVKFCKRCGKTK